MGYRYQPPDQQHDQAEGPAEEPSHELPRDRDRDRDSGGVGELAPVCPPGPVKRSL